MTAFVVERGAEAGASAVFSSDLRMRYRLTRKIAEGGARRVVFVMLNPSTADEFKLDPTINRCAEFARRWEMHDLEVVNLFAFRTPKPSVLRAHIREGLIRFPDATRALEWCGADARNDRQILEACVSATRVIAAWGNGEALLTYGNRTRGAVVRDMLASNQIALYRFGATESGAPLHPLARGKSWVPYDRELERWT